MRRHARGLLSALLTADLVLAGTAQASSAPLPDIPGAVLPSTVFDSTFLRGIDLDQVTVLDLQHAMDTHRLSSVALTSFYLDRIQALNPTLHAVIETNPDALKDAAASDRHRRQQGGRGPLEGIPVLLKDNIDTADRTHTTAGSYALLGARPAQDAYLVQRLRAAGAIVLGKANLSEWAHFRSFVGPSGWSPRGGQTANPYVLDRNPCGSSSGSAVAAAADLATVTIGTDTAGSVVCPAGANDDVGIRPTLGLVSRSGLIPITAQMDTAGPITRNMTDAAAVLQVIQGVDPADPATAAATPYTGRDYLAALDKNALRGKRIGVWRGGGDVPEANAVLASTIKTLRQKGAVIVDDIALPGFTDLLNDGLPAVELEFKHDFNAYLAALPGDHPADLAALIAYDDAHASVEMPYFGQDNFIQAQATSGDESDPAYQQLRAAVTAAARNTIDTAMAADHLDAILAPTNAPAWVTDLQAGDPPTILPAYSGAVAVAGYPELTVPAGYDSHGVLPIGMSFFGGRFSEPTLISLGYALEQATHARRAPTFLPTLP